MVKQEQVILEAVDLNDPHVQGFIEAAAICLVYVAQQDAPGPEVEHKGKSLALELWNPHPVAVEVPGRKQQEKDG